MVLEDVWGQFDDDYTRPGAPLFPSERRCADGSSRRVGDDAPRNGLAAAVEAHLPGWAEKLTPHVLRHFCASELYSGGLDLVAIQAVLGHSWIAMAMRYVHVQQTRVEDAWLAGQQRAAKRLEGLMG
ncbi:tyrosine-type recombinase/integrase [Streptomyces fuscichromogenes]|uniref:tyrosine-type recombinase/integrase n=1 Tax=Streptomyces fuscichromogenes TaxID=1324013 RepID=UPI0037F75FC5